MTYKISILKICKIFNFLDTPFIKIRFKSEQKPLEFYFITEHKYQCLRHIFHIQELKENIYVESKNHFTWLCNDTWWKWESSKHNSLYNILNNCLLPSQSKQLRQLSIYCYFRLQMLYTEACIYTKASSAFKYLHKKPLYH